MKRHEADRDHGSDEEEEERPEHGRGRCHARLRAATFRTA